METDINNFICMCYQNINGIKRFTDNYITVTPWKDWITDTIKCSLFYLKHDNKFFTEGTHKVYNYAMILNRSQFSKEDIIEFLEKLLLEDSVKQSINLLNILEIIKYNNKHNTEYININDNTIIESLNNDVEVLISDKTYICVNIQTKDKSYMIERNVFDATYKQNKKTFDFIIKDTQDQEASSTCFEFIPEIIYN